MRKDDIVPLALAATAAGAVIALAACTGPAQAGKVTGWQYKPPSVQSVDVSCSWWSGSGSSGKYGSSYSGSGSAYCLDENTEDVPEPQVCTLKLSTGAAVRLNLAEAACRAYLGQRYPAAGGDMAGGS